MCPMVFRKIDLSFQELRLWRRFNTFTITADWVN